MSSRLVKFIPFAKVEDNIFRVVQTILKVDKVEHEIANRVKDDILRKHFRDSHGLSLRLWIPSSAVITSLRLLATPKTSLESLAEGAHEVTRLLHHLALVFLHPFFLLVRSSIFFLLNCFLEFLIKNFLQNRFPNVFFLPNTVVVYELCKVLFFETLFMSSWIYFWIHIRFHWLEIDELWTIEYSIDNLEVNILFMDDSCK